MLNDREKVNSLISLGGDIAGSAVGGAIGFLAGGPTGAAIGEALGVVISKSSMKLLSDFADRTLSKREKIRVGATAAFALVKIESHLDAGFTPRDDGFFETKGKERSDAEEIFEGVLLKAKNEHEEKKAKILGNIFANIAFYRGFSVGEANHLIRIANDLTYRGMCIIALIARKDQNLNIKLREESYREFEGEIYYETISILQEAYQIYNYGLIACKMKSSESYEALLDWTAIAPNRMELTLLGKRYHKVMGLEDIPEEEVKEVAKYLT